MIDGKSDETTQITSNILIVIFLLLAPELALYQSSTYYSLLYYPCHDVNYMHSYMYMLLHLINSDSRNPDETIAS